MQVHQMTRSILGQARQLARTTVRSLDRTLPWLNGARELSNMIEVALAIHFERQLEEPLALCSHCGGSRVNYCEREGATGVSFDGCSEMRTESGYLCADCCAFEDSVIAFEYEVAA
jgi:hypothetical protein